MSQNLKFNLNRLQALKNYRYAKATVENGHDSPDAITIADSVDGHSSTENGIDEDSEECHSMDESSDASDSEKTPTEKVKTNGHVSKSSPWLSKDQGKLTNSKCKIKPKARHKRMKVHSDTDSDTTSESDIESDHKDDEANESLSGRSITLQEFNSRVQNLKETFPHLTKESLEEYLASVDDDVEAAIDEISTDQFRNRIHKRQRIDSESLGSIPSQPVFKRIRRMSSSDSFESCEPESVNVNEDTELDSQARDERLSTLYEIFPDKTLKQLQEVLEQNDWDVNTATTALSNTKCTKFKQDEYSDGDDGNSEAGSYDTDDGYDEDDPFIRDEHKTMILNFFETAVREELVIMNGCSLKKADAIVALRPFGTWKNLEASLSSAKTLSVTILFGCREVIQVREVVKRLMQKCQKISEKMEKVVECIVDKTLPDEHDDDLQITTQPLSLNPKLQLKPYQIIGLNWLRIIHNQELNGILADEMGLGKTIQAIAFLAHLIEEGETGPHAVIVPSSTIDNWLSEFTRWCPSIKVMVYYGSQEERRLARNELLYDSNSLYHVVLTTYNMATGTGDDKTLFKKFQFHYAIFDEGHLLKNMSTRRYVNLMKISADRRLLLTGTPLQNNLVELMSLLSFVMPEMFTGKTEQLKRMFTMTSKRGEKRTSYEEERIEHAKRIMKPFVLRRLKVDVLKQLPGKHETIERCTMLPCQQKLYDDLVHQYRRRMNSEADKMDSSSVFMQLRKAANHPLLHRVHFTDEKLTKMAQLISKEPSHEERGALPHIINEDMAVMSDYELHTLCECYKGYIGDFALDHSLLMESAKFVYLNSKLEELKNQDDRVLLFSQFTMMLDIVQDYVKMKGYKYLRLDGQTPVNERQIMIDRYNSDPSIFLFLLSTRAGGLGINLATANVVILHDIDFNPYNDKQAEDRCHRMGQTRDVHVIKLICKGSVEEAMLRCAEDKLRLEKDITNTTSEPGDKENTANMASLLQSALAEYTSTDTE